MYKNDKITDTHKLFLNILMFLDFTMLLEEKFLTISTPKIEREKLIRFS